MDENRANRALAGQGIELLTLAETCAEPGHTAAACGWYGCFDHVNAACGTVDMAGHLSALLAEASTA
ncbi:MAG: hypothetical protein Q4F13_10280 [Pseudomonadota bacterium]|nr:hypothetical protein [Pseudomonadota bacterium]